MVSIRNWVTEKFVTPANTLSALQIGLSVAIGIWGGVFPIPALSTFATLALCTAILANMFNAAMTTIAVAVNVIVTPLQFLLMPRFMNLPSILTGSASCSISDLMESIKTKSLLETSSSFGLCLVWGVFAWAVSAPLAIFAIRAFVAYLFKLGKRD